MERTSVPIDLSAEHEAFLRALCPDLSMALAQVLEIHMAQLRQMKQVNGSLFGPELAPARGPRRAGPAIELVDWFVKAWAYYRDGAVYEPKRRDFVAAANLLRRHSLADIKARANNLFMRTGDWWIDSCSLSLLESRWNVLALERGE